MSDRTTTPAHRSRAPFMVVFSLLVIALAAVIYYAFFASQGPKRVHVALVTWNEDPFWDPVIAGARDAATDFNAELTVIKSKPTLEAQNGHMRDLVSQGVDGLAISPNDPAAQASLLKEFAAKCPIVTFDIDAPDSQRRVFVGIDNYSAGHFAADEVREAMPGGANVIITVGSLEMPHGRDRRQGVIDGLVDRQYRMDHPVDPLDVVLKGKTYTITSTVIDHGDVAKSTSLLADALKAHPEVNCVVALFSYSAEAALHAIEQAGRSGKVTVVGFDDTEATQAGIENGTIYASILQDTYRMGNEAVRLIAEEAREHSMKGPTGPRKVIVEIDVLRKDTLAIMREDGRARKPKSAATTQETGSTLR